MRNKEKAFQQKQLEELRSGEEGCYDDASIYTILLDLCEGNGVDHVFIMLHNVASEMGQRAELEAKFDEAKSWKWDNETT